MKDSFSVAYGMYRRGRNLGSPVASLEETEQSPDMISEIIKRRAQPVAQGAVEGELSDDLEADPIEKDENELRRERISRIIGR